MKHNQLTQSKDGKMRRRESIDMPASHVDDVVAKVKRRSDYRERVLGGLKAGELQAQAQALQGSQQQTRKTGALWKYLSGDEPDKSTGGPVKSPRSSPTSPNESKWDLGWVSGSWRGSQDAT